MLWENLKLIGESETWQPFLLALSSPPLLSCFTLEPRLSPPAGFSRLVAAVYGCCLLTVFLRVQLSILGGCMFLDLKKVRARHRVRG